VTAPQPAVAAVADPSDVPWRRLDKRMLAIRPVNALFRAAIPLLVVLFGSRGASQEWIGLGGAGVVVFAGMAHWFTTRYRIGPTQVQLVTGLLRRRRLAVPIDRIRSVDVTASPLHRLLGVAIVKVGTGRQGGGRDDELALDAVSAAEAVRLRDELLHRRDVASGHATEDSPAASTVPETVIARFDPSWLRYAPFTLSGLVTAGTIVGFGANFANEARVDLGRLGPLRSATQQLEQAPLALAVTVGALLLLVLVSLLSVGGYLVAFWNFTLTRHPGGTLHVQRGLLTTRAVSLEERRLRGAEIGEPLLLRSAGGARATAIATGLTGGRGRQGGSELLLPPAPAREAHRVVAEVLRGSDPTVTPLRRHGPAARRRRYVRALTAAIVVIAVLHALHRWAGLPNWPWQLALLLLPVAVLLAADRYRNLGHALTPAHLVGRTGSVVRETYALRRDGIIGWRLHQTLFQRRAGLVTLVATTAGGRSAYEVPDVEEAVGIALADEAVPGLLAPFVVR
jgi:putative membrane protein